MIRLLIIFVIIFLPGCFNFRVNGHEINCFRIFPDIDFLIENKIKTPIDDWYLPGKTDEDRMRKWIECGGDSRGYYEGYVRFPEKSNLSTEEYEKRKRGREICMMDAGYLYIGSCLEYSKSPSCHEINLDKFPPRARERIWESREKWEAREELDRQKRIRRESREK